MRYIDEIELKVIEYLDGDYQIKDTQKIPSINEVPFGKTAHKMKLCAYCIDIRNSTKLLIDHHKQTSGKIHKAFLAAVSKVVLENEGSIRSFNGDGLLAFWPADYQSQISKAIKAAMITKWLLHVKFSSYFEKYEKLDFGIGIDWSDVYIMRAGIPRDTNNNDLIFIGKCVNYATAIAKQAGDPIHIEISEEVYYNLEDAVLYGYSNGQKVDMWKDGVVKWKKEDYKSKYTGWHFNLENNTFQTSL